MCPNIDKKYFSNIQLPLYPVFLIRVGKFCLSIIKKTFSFLKPKKRTFYYIEEEHRFQCENDQIRSRINSPWL